MNWLWKPKRQEPFDTGRAFRPASSPGEGASAKPIAPEARPAPIESPISEWLKELHAKFKDAADGRLANYIPELTRADPAHFGIALATADGQVYAVGDAQAQFTMQSISKPLIYGLALEDHGPDEVLRKVGVEPTGEAFNSIVMDEVHNRPFNPMVNAGAIAITSLVKGDGHDERLGRILDMLSRFAGRTLEIDRAVFQSERSSGNRNRAIGYLQLSSGMIEEPLLEHLDLYFEQCSVLVTARDLALMGATLANNGVNPTTGERAIAAQHVKSVLSIMASCGMYDFSGEWVYRVGLPAKSGVGGGIMAVLPGQFGFGVFSPLLDKHGNSHRGIEVCKELSRRFHLHTYDAHFAANRILRRTYRCDTVSSKRLRGARERQVLDREGGRIIVYELQGALHFATAEQLLRRIPNDLNRTSFVILDGRRVGRADRSALLLLRDLGRSLKRNGARLLFASLNDRIKADWLALQDEPEPALAALDLDLTVEHCEDLLIAEVEPAARDSDAELPLGEMDILRKLTPEQIARLEPHIERASYAAGEAIVREGDAADRLFMLASGTATVSSQLDDGRRSARLAAFGPGVTFGEFALFDGGRRTADVIAAEAASCYVLTFARLAELEKSEADGHHRIIFELGRILSDRLRRVSAEVKALL